jgi:cytosine/uracil/thiamine/allantoin permease
VSLPLPPLKDQSSEIIIANPSSIEEAREDFSSHEERSKSLANQSTEQDIKQRQKFADSAYKITFIWTVFIIGISTGQLTARFWDKGLHDSEFIAVLTTTTASVFGFWYLVGRYLFKNSDK